MQTYKTEAEAWAFAVDLAYAYAYDLEAIGEGDVVHDICGGPAMTVVAEWKRGLRCWWFEGGSLKKKTFGRTVLTPHLTNGTLPGIM